MQRARTRDSLLPNPNIVLTIQNTNVSAAVNICWLSDGITKGEQNIYVQWMASQIGEMRKRQRLRLRIRSQAEIEQ